MANLVIKNKTSNNNVQLTFKHGTTDNAVIKSNKTAQSLELDSANVKIVKGKLLLSKNGYNSIQFGDKWLFEMRDSTKTGSSYNFDIYRFPDGSTSQSRLISLNQSVGAVIVGGNASDSTAEKGIFQVYNGKSYFDSDVKIAGTEEVNVLKITNSITGPVLIKRPSGGNGISERLSIGCITGQSGIGGASIEVVGTGDSTSGYLLGNEGKVKYGLLSLTSTDNNPSAFKIHDYNSGLSSLLLKNSDEILRDTAISCAYYGTKYTGDGLYVHGAAPADGYTWDDIIAANVYEEGKSPSEYDISKLKTKLYNVIDSGNIDRFAITTEKGGDLYPDGVIRFMNMGLDGENDYAGSLTLRLKPDSQYGGLGYYPNMTDKTIKLIPEITGHSSYHPYSWVNGNDRSFTLTPDNLFFGWDRYGEDYYSSQYGANGISLLYGPPEVASVIGEETTYLRSSDLFLGYYDEDTIYHTISILPQSISFGSQADGGDLYDWTIKNNYVDTDLGPSSSLIISTGESKILTLYSDNIISFKDIVRSSSTNYTTKITEKGFQTTKGSTKYLFGYNTNEKFGIHYNDTTIMQIVSSSLIYSYATFYSYAPLSLLNNSNLNITSDSGIDIWSYSNEDHHLQIANSKLYFESKSNTGFMFFDGVNEDFEFDIDGKSVFTLGKENSYIHSCLNIKSSEAHADKAMLNLVNEADASCELWLGVANTPSWAIRARAVDDETSPYSFNIFNKRRGITSLLISQTTGMYFNERVTLNDLLYLTENKGYGTQHPDEVFVSDTSKALLRDGTVYYQITE